MDEEGYFFTVVRKKDLIISSGFNIYPIEMESVIYQHTAVTGRRLVFLESRILIAGKLSKRPSF
ncbi:hypothetical protein R4Z10_21185 (plasmid) [Niallia sp. XMNu-256]|uniref:hypothetical protein n=1 Tax=Niallia sp. XMNu-256 TaxID=3082444 RepID=UPI0030D4DA5E